MTVEFRLPDVGEGVTEGELIAWHVKEGDQVEEDQPIAEVETDKALVEIPSPVDGTVASLHNAPGDIIPVGDVFVTFTVEDEPATPTETDEESPTQEQPDRVFASPSVRQLAREHEVDLSAIEGTGPGGRLTADDVERASAEGDAEGTPTVEVEPDETAERDRTLAVPATRRIANEEGIDLEQVPASDTIEGEAYVSLEDIEGFTQTEAAREPSTTAPPTERDEPASATERIPYRGVRKTIGERMEQSKFTAPHVTHHELIEVPTLVETRARLREEVDDDGPSLTYLPFVIRALAAAIEEHPHLNATLDEENEEIVIKPEVHVGIAVATEVGLMVPVVESVERKGLLELAGEISRLAQRARDRTIAPDELSGSTITITNFGAIGGDYATPIINYPEVAVVGLGELKQRPVVRDGEVVAEYTLPLSISIDHRVIDGAEVAAFAQTLGEYLAEPAKLLLR